MTAEAPSSAQPDGKVRKKGNNSLESFTIITTTASPELADIHHRQPAIIAPDRFDDWLDPTSPVLRLLDLVREPYGGP